MRLKRDVLYLVVAISALAAGLVFYVLGRSPEYVYFLPQGVGFGASLHSILAPLGNNLPTFVHTFAFILLTAAVILPHTRRAAFALSATWIVLEALLELAQLPLIASRIAAAVPGWFAKVPVLDNTAAYFVRGTFDPLDLLSIVLGALAAYATILIGLKWEQRQQSVPLPTAKHHRLWFVPVAIAALATTVASGGGGGGSVGIGALDTNSHLYVVDNATPGQILSFNNANAVNGTVSPTFTISGTSTSLNNPTGIAVDMGRNLIYVANFSSDSILVFFNARSATGNVSPRTTIPLPTSSGPSALYLDHANDRLYVVNTTSNSVAVFDHVSAATNTTLPNRVLSSPALNSPDGITLDMTRGMLYVANGAAGAGAILAFSVSATDGSISSAPVNTIAGSTNTTLNHPVGLFVDAQTDRLYIANSGNHSVIVYNNASTRFGDIAPDRHISITGTAPATPQDVFVDTGTDQLYVSDDANDAILVFNSASTVSDNPTPPIPPTPSRTLSLPLSTAPLGIFVDVTPIVIGSNKDLDGYVRSDGNGSSSGSPAVGVQVGLGWGQLYSFDTPGVPSSVQVQSATLHLYQCLVVPLTFGSTPYDVLGDVIVDHVDFGGTFPPGGYSSLSVAGNIGILSTNTNYQYKTLGVTSSVQSDMAAGLQRSQYGLLFTGQVGTTFPSSDTYVQFTDAENSVCGSGALTPEEPPQLIMTIVP